MARYRFTPGDKGRECFACGDWKDWSEFSIHRTAKSGHQSTCRTCGSEAYEAKQKIHKVYAIRCDDAVKIGRSTSAEAEIISRYKTGNARPVHLIVITHCADKKQGMEFEDELHDVHRHRWIQGEWHQLHDDPEIQPTERYYTHEYRRKYG